MPVQGRTREQLRQSIGYNLGALKSGTATSGSTNTLVDVNTFRGGDDTYNGKLVLVTDATDGTTQTTQFANDYTASTNTIRFQQNSSFTVASGDSYEIWNEPYDPSIIHDFINQAIIDATGQAYDPVENPDMSSSSHTALHADGKVLRFDIPSNISIINHIYYRSSVSFTSLHNCNAAFDEHSTLVVTTLNGAISDADATSVTVTSATPLRANQQILVGSEKMTISSISSNTLTVSRGAGATTAATHSDGASVLLFPVVDTQDKKQGTGSNKFIIPTAAGTNQIVTESISSKDISKYDYLEGWIKSTTATSSGNLQILLDNTANSASPLETLDIPALAADTWTYFRVELANPETDTAIISIGLKQAGTDLDACTVFIDDLKVVENDTAIWEIFPKHLWKLDRSSRDLIITEDGKFASGYAMLKITGGDKPALLSADSGTTEIDDSYIIARATGLAFASASGGPNTDPDQLRQQAAFWLGLAEQAKRSFPLIITGRAVE